MTRTNIEIRGLEQFLKKVKRTSGDRLKREVTSWLDATGHQFLHEVQNQIIAMQVVDTRRLLNSFDKGDHTNMWRISNGGLTLDVGTKLNYAQAVNDGHWMNGPGVASRWVPGHWIGNRFEYDPAARDSGMLLRQQWVNGQPYWDNALAIFKQMFGRSFDRRFEQWVNEMGW